MDELAQQYQDLEQGGLNKATIESHILAKRLTHYINCGLNDFASFFDRVPTNSGVKEEKANLYRGQYGRMGCCEERNCKLV